MIKGIGWPPDLELMASSLAQGIGGKVQDHVRVLFMDRAPGRNCIEFASLSRRD